MSDSARRGQLVPRSRSPWMAAAAVAVVYALAAKLSFLVTIPPGNISPIFPSAGVALAGALLLGRPALIGVWLGSFAANLASFCDGTVTAGLPTLSGLLVAAATASGAALGAAAGAAATRRLCGSEHPLERGRNVLALLVIGAGVCCAISSTVGVTSLALGGYLPWSGYQGAWITWWAGDAAGAVVTAPFLLAWLVGAPAGDRRGQRGEEAATLLLVTAVGATVFLRDVHAEYVLMPLVLWSGYRHGRRGASAVVLLTATLATLGASLGRGPFQSHDMVGTVMLLYSFLGVTTICALFVAAVLNEWRLAEAALLRQQLQQDTFIDMATELINLPTEAQATTVASYLRRLSEFLAADAAFLLDNDQPELVARVQQVWQRQPGPAVDPPSAPRLPLTALPDALVSSDGLLWIAPVAGQPEGPWRALLESAGAASAIAAPCRAGGLSLGCVILCWRDAREPLPEADQNLITVFASIMASLRRRTDSEAAGVRLEAQLGQAQKMESVGRLAGGVAHDFNNMLGVILGNVEEALGQRDPTELRSALEEIRGAAERSAELTKQLLAFARKQEVAPRVLDLNVTVAGMTKMLQRLIGENIRLTWRPRDGLWPVNIDPSQIDQILANLCVNARDAIADVGSITIETCNATFYQDDLGHNANVVSGDYVQLAVSDDGCGMDRETLALAFEPFFTTKGTGQGTGLGLATVYGAVKQNGGFINVYSEPGLGTTFTVYLPRHRAEVAATSVPTADADGGRGQGTILLVEDEPAILRSTTRLLQRHGYTVLGYTSPTEALRAARGSDQTIDLLITDVVMPEMNGLALSEQVLAARPEARCLYMSGYTADAIAQHGMSATHVHLIQKPFPSAALLRRVSELLAGARAEAGV